MHALQSSSVSSQSPVFRSRRKVSHIQQAFLWTLLKEDPDLPSRKVLQRAERQVGRIKVGIRQLNRMRVEWCLNGIHGRPQGPEARKSTRGELISVQPNISFVGVHLFAAWMEQHDGFSFVLVLLKQMIARHKVLYPLDPLPLLFHRDETLLVRFKALFYAPLFGIGKLSEYDVKEHALETVIGRSYQSSTLNQFLGQLECLDAGRELMPALAPDDVGRVCYVDGHMIAFWTAASLHKGKITMLGRIMAGSQAVVAHDEEGHALHVEYYPPDINMTHFIVDYCERIVYSTGIDIFVIDRAINSLDMAVAFQEKGLGLLSMLNSNQYKDLSDWDTQYEGELEDGSKVHSGRWRDPGKEDPRYFVIVEKDGDLLVYWATLKIQQTIDPMQWPVLYHQRTEVQENSFKRMIDHGALNVNYGAKKIVGPDRHQQRALNELKEKLTQLELRHDQKKHHIAEQEEKVRESEEKGHGKRLSQRRDRLEEMEKGLNETIKQQEKVKSEIEALGPPGQRADRDFRKQLIMTFRTLLLENKLMAFVMSLLNEAKITIGVDTIMDLLFKRSGDYIETCSHIIYQLSTTGLSGPYVKILQNIAQGLNVMNLEQKGKPVRVQLREAPT